MKKIIFLTTAVLGFNLAANAQSSSGASQSTALSLSNAIAVTFTGSGSSNGGSVSVPFSSVADFTNGITTSVQTLKVQSNKLFNLGVSVNAANFTYSGTASPAPVMPISGVLALQVTGNGAGGLLNSLFNALSSTLSTAEQTLVSLGSNGGNQTLSLQYKATPGFAYPAGTYTANVVFTTTQP